MNLTLSDFVSHIVAKYGKGELDNDLHIHSTQANDRWYFIPTCETQRVTIEQVLTI